MTDSGIHVSARVGAILVASPDAAARILDELPHARRVGTIAARRQSPVELTPTP